METAIVVTWAIGLAGAAVATLVIVKQVALILRTLRHVRELAEVTREAARGIVGNVGTVPRLGTLAEHAGALREAERALAEGAGSLGHKLGVGTDAPDAREA